MELTKQDKKHIQERVRRLNFRIVEEANAYMNLYQKTYYEEVIKMCQAKIDAIDFLHEQTLKISNNETQTCEENNGVVQRKWRLLHHQPSQIPQRELLEKDAKVTPCLHQREWCICATFNARH